DLSADRRDVHTVHSGQPSRLLGMDVILARVGPGVVRHRLETDSRRAIPNCLDGRVRCDGLDRFDRSQTAACGYSNVGSRLAGRRWFVLHGRRGVLRVKTNTLQSRDMARLRYGRKHLSLLRGDVLCTPQCRLKFAHHSIALKLESRQMSVLYSARLAPGRYDALQSQE